MLAQSVQTAGEFFEARGVKRTAAVECLSKGLLVTTIRVVELSTRVGRRERYERHSTSDEDYVGQSHLDTVIDRAGSSSPSFSFSLSFSTKQALPFSRYAAGTKATIFPSYPTVSWSSLFIGRNYTWIPTLGCSKLSTFSLLFCYCFTVFFYTHARTTLIRAPTNP